MLLVPDGSSRYRGGTAEGGVSQRLYSPVSAIKIKTLRFSTEKRTHNEAQNLYLYFMFLNI